MSEAQLLKARNAVPRRLRIVIWVLVGAAILYPLVNYILTDFDLSLRLNPYIVAFLYVSTSLSVVAAQVLVTAHSSGARRSGSALLVLLWSFLGAALCFFQLASVEEWHWQQSDVKRLADGRLYRLVLDTDIVDGSPFVHLLRKVRMVPFVWAYVPGEDELTQPGLYGGYSRNPGLTITPDQRHLLVSRGGFWTDCIDVSRDDRACAGFEVLGPVMREEHPDIKQVTSRSKAIEKLVGLPPPKIGED